MILKRYNINKKQHIKLLDGEKFCPKCDGRGRVRKSKRSDVLSIMLQCDKCLGDGKIDWIEEATGKKTSNLDRLLYGFKV